MKQELLDEIEQEFTMPTAEDAVSYLFKNGLISPKAVRDHNIRKHFKRLSLEEPARSKVDIMHEISAIDELGLPSFSTVRNAVYCF